MLYFSIRSYAGIFADFEDVFIFGYYYIICIIDYFYFFVPHSLGLSKK